MIRGKAINRCCRISHALCGPASSAREASHRRSPTTHSSVCELPGRLQEPTPKAVINSYRLRATAVMFMTTPFHSGDQVRGFPASLSLRILHPLLPIEKLWLTLERITMTLWRNEEETNTVLDPNNPIVAPPCDHLTSHMT
jgi:hypothetical protein